MSVAKRRHLATMCLTGTAIIVGMLSDGVYSAVSSNIGRSINQGPGYRHPLTALRNQSGWISLGLIDVDSGKWATVLKFKLANPASGQKRIVPEPGDLLILTEPLTVYIDDYGTDGESKFESPLPEEPLTPNDRTGVVLPRDSRVIVRAAVRGTPTGKAQSVWARVAPEP